MSGPRVFQVVGTSGAGKTRAIEIAVRTLRRKRLRVAVVKHSHHRIDLAGKDTDRFRQSGADLVLFGSDISAILGRFDPRGLLPLLPVDVVLVEGYSRHRLSTDRFVVGGPREAVEVAGVICARAPSRRRRSGLTLDGRAAPSHPMWEFIANLMDQREVVRIERRSRPSPRRVRMGRRAPTEEAESAGPR